jgi:leucyl aminopeptidase
MISVDEAFDRGQTRRLQFEYVEREALFAKRLVDRPRLHLGPTKFAQILERRSRSLGVSCESLALGGDKGIATQRVGQAAVEMPQILRIAYSGAPRDRRGHLWLCGKGVTMDTGGLGLKGQAGMRAMKTDMAGAAVAAGAVFAAARLQLPVNVTAAVALAENAIGPTAMAPGDLIRYPDGPTVEVTDTDSEGRLVLADLCLMAAAHGASTVLTIGTLTELISWSIGRDRAGLQTRSEGLARQLQAAGSRSGEPIWHLPIPSEHRSLMDGGWVDLVNSAGPAYGGIQPALFLERFIGGLEWGHLEICGPSFVQEWGGTSATGYGVGLLVEFMRGIESSEGGSD